jgi:hypothetical protein
MTDASNDAMDAVGSTIFSILMNYPGSDLDLIAICFAAFTIGLARRKIIRISARRTCARDSGNCHAVDHCQTAK